MIRVADCRREPEVVEAVLLGRWPGRVDEELTAHASACPVCREAALVADVFETDVAAARHEAAGRLLPGGIVWWRAQLRARQEARRAAIRPITAAQLVAAAAGMGAAGAVFGATAEWFQTSLVRAATAGRALVPDVSGWTESVTATMAGYAAIVVVIALVFCLAPIAVYVALGEE